MPFKITELFAFCAIDSADGDEGVAGFINPMTGLAMPMVGANMERVESLMDMAKQVAKMSGKPVTLCRFSKREVLKVINPDGTETTS
jgi:hypothetical protein